MKKVLHVLGNLGYGGAEMFVMNIYRNIDRRVVQFDFLVRQNNNGPLVKEIEELGGNVVILPDHRKHIIGNHIVLSRYMKEHHSEYCAIHVHANSLIYVYPLYLAKKYNIPIRIIHSHSTKGMCEPLHQLNINRIDKWVTHRIACSMQAGQYMFPRKKFQVIQNGIDLDLFQYDEEKRNAIRKKLGVGNITIIGHVGRITPPKNHPFIIEIFEEYQKKDPSSILLLIGDGEETEKIKKLVRQKRLSGQVIFTGPVSNVHEYLSAMDLFLFPSLWEGLGIVLIEAQQNGLRCLVSENIPEIADMGLCRVASLDEDKSVWAQRLKELLVLKRGKPDQKIMAYDIKRISQDLQNLYLSVRCSPSL